MIPVDFVFLWDLAEETSVLRTEKKTNSINNTFDTIKGYIFS